MYLHIFHEEKLVFLSKLRVLGIVNCHQWVGDAIKK